jgi:transposase
VQQRSDVVAKRNEWLNNQKRFNHNRIIFIDESSINCGMTSRYGRAHTSQRVKEYVPDSRFEQTTVISSIRTTGKYATLVFKGALNGEWFFRYVKKILSPTLKKDDIVILDNLSVHKSKNALEIIKSKGAKVCFLPPYSPDLNPIELCWSKMKAIVRKLKPRSQDALIFAMNMALSSIGKSNIINWYKHCGYGINQ